MASGYNCCVDIERLNGSIETLNSIETCLSNKSLSDSFIEIESILKEVNFLHSNCITNYKEPISSILEKLTEIRKEIGELTVSLTKTVTEFGKAEELDLEDLKDLSSTYGESYRIQVEEAIRLNPNINVSSSVIVFQENMDDSIRNFMMNNPLTDYPMEYQSLEDWQNNLLEKYKETNLNELEKEQMVEKDMAIWRQEQTGSSVTSVVTSDYAEQQANINALQDTYQEEYNLSETDARNLATLKEEYNRASTLKATEEMETLKNEIERQEEKLGINFRKTSLASAPYESSIENTEASSNGESYTQIPPATSNETTTIPPVDTTSETTHQEINTVPIGLGIAATGIAGSVGAVVIDSINSKRKDTLEYYEEPKESIEEYYIPDQNKNKELAPSIEDPTPYYAMRNKESIDKFYGENSFSEEDE